MPKDQYLLSSVYNALEILDLLSKCEEIGVAEISKELDMGKTSVFRLLYTLEKKDFVHKTSNAKYKLGMKFAYYGAMVSERQNVLSVARPYLQKLRDELNETVHMSILDEDYNIIFMLKEVGNTSIQMGSRIGAKLPSYCTGTGKALLANLAEKDLKKGMETIQFLRKTNNTITNKLEFLEEIQKIKMQGYAEDLEESEVGLVCYAAPIKDITGSAVAAVSVSGPSVRMRQNRVFLIEKIKETAEKISKAMGYVERNG